MLGSPQRSADDAKGYIVYRRSPTLGHPLSSNLCFALNFHRMSCSRPVVVYSPPFVPSSYTILSCTSNSIFYKYLILGSASMARFSRACCVDVTRVFLVFPSCQNDSPASPYLANGESESEMGSQRAAKSLNLPGPLPARAQRAVCISGTAMPSSQPQPESPRHRFQNFGAHLR